MKELLALSRVTFAALFLTGCLLRTATVSPRHFVLAPMPANESNRAPNSHLSVEIGFVKMPAYLLRDSIAVRTGPNEIQYLEDSLWAERLDKSFQRALVANLSHSFPSAEIQPTDFLRRDHALEKTAYPNPLHVGGPEGPKTVRIQVSVEQFDVDTKGNGKLAVQWRILAPDSKEVLRSGNSNLTRMGNSPHRNAAAIAKTMSVLTAEFSHELAQSISEPIASGTLLP